MWEGTGTGSTRVDPGQQVQTVTIDESGDGTASTRKDCNTDAARRRREERARCALVCDRLVELTKSIQATYNRSGNLKRDANKNMDKELDRIIAELDEEQLCENKDEQLGIITWATKVDRVISEIARSKGFSNTLIREMEMTVARGRVAIERWCEAEDQESGAAERIPEPDRNLTPQRQGRETTHETILLMGWKAEAGTEEEVEEEAEADLDARGTKRPAGELDMNASGESPPPMPPPLSKARTARTEEEITGPMRTTTSTPQNSGRASQQNPAGTLTEAQAPALWRNG